MQRCIHQVNECVLGLKAKARIESTVYQLMQYILGRARDERRLIEKVCLDCLRARQGTECILGVILHVILLLSTLHGRPKQSKRWQISLNACTMPRHQTYKVNQRIEYVNF